MSGEFIGCPHCGSRLEYRIDHGVEHYSCPTCKYDRGKWVDVKPTLPPERGIKPCPVCHDRAEVGTSIFKQYYIRCCRCGYTTGSYDAKDQAIRNHNINYIAKHLDDDDGWREYAESERQRKSDACDRNDGRWDTREEPSQREKELY